MATRTVISRVSGHVQGVGFRVWVMREAQARGVNGWVRNCPDGTVEAVFSGEPEAVIEMQMRCYVGPSASRPTSVVSDPFNDIPGEGFEIRG